MNSAKSEKTLHIAICGTRGIPACYGGFETFAEELGTRLVEKGHTVTVYGRSHVIDYKEKTYRGVNIELLPAPKHKYLETPVHTCRSLIALLKKQVDVVLVCNAANSPFVWIPRLFGIPVVVNLDGIERKRSKWNWLGRAWYRFGEICSVLFASKLIGDAEMIRNYYKSVYGRDSVVLRYGMRNQHQKRVENKVAIDGAVEFSPQETEVFAQFGLTPGEYLLYVSRLEPENNAHVVVEAYSSLPQELRKMPLVVVGDAPYAAEYIAKVKSLAGENVVFCGYQFGAAYEMLQLGAYLYVQATEVGGTHPALVEAMGFGNCVVANRVPEHEEVLGDAGWYYEKNSVESLRGILSELIQNKERVKACQSAAFSRASEMFSWGKITNNYEELLLLMCGRQVASESTETRRAA